MIINWEWLCVRWCLRHPGYPWIYYSRVKWLKGHSLTVGRINITWKLPT